jgi:predicted RNA-binding protein with PUA-like domain
MRKTNSMNYWLMKFEPKTFSFDMLEKDGRTNWNGVQDFQAQNHLKNVTIGDKVLIYQSGKEKAVIGIAKALKEAYADPDPNTPGDWFQVDLGFEGRQR